MKLLQKVFLMKNVYFLVRNQIFGKKVKVKPTFGKEKEKAGKVGRERAGREGRERAGKEERGTVGKGKARIGKGRERVGEEERERAGI